ncbi:hypothetical protein AAY473_007583 [Plecturocebus cupreus]
MPRRVALKTPDELAALWEADKGGSQSQEFKTMLANMRCHGASKFLQSWHVPANTLRSSNSAQETCKNQPVSSYNPGMSPQIY